MADKFVNIGFTKKPHGSRGQIKVVIHEEFIEDFANSEHVFINLMGKPAPFFIESIDVVGDILLKVDNINSPDEAKAITSQDLFLRETDLSKKPKQVQTSNSLQFDDIVGFILFDLEQGEVGEVKEIQEFPQQEMAVIEYKGKDIYIPLHPDLIDSIEVDAKKITLQLPEGLLDL